MMLEKSSVDVGVVAVNLVSAGVLKNLLAGVELIAGLNEESMVDSVETLVLKRGELPSGQNVGLLSNCSSLC